MRIFNFMKRWRLSWECCLHTRSVFFFSFESTTDTTLSHERWPRTFFFSFCVVFCCPISIAWGVNQCQVLSAGESNLWRRKTQKVPDYQWQFTRRLSMIYTACQWSQCVRIQTPRRRSVKYDLFKFFVRYMHKSSNAKQKRKPQSVKVE